MCVLWRVVNTVRFLEACLFATLVLPTFPERRRAVNRPGGRGVSAVPRPAPLAKHGAPQDSRKDLTSSRVETERKRNGTAGGIRGPRRL